MLDQYHIGGTPLFFIVRVRISPDHNNPGNAGAEPVVGLYVGSSSRSRAQGLQHSGQELRRWIAVYIKPIQGIAYFLST